MFCMLLLQAVPTGNSQLEAREQVRQKGRMSITLMQSVRNNQWGQQIQEAVDGPEEERTIPIDDDISLKQKCCLHLESLLASIEMGASM